MKRFGGAAVGLILLLASSLQAANVSGTVTFLTKRGQRPNAAETLVSLEPVGARPAIKRQAVTVAMTTRGKMLIPHVLAIPVGSTVTFPNEDPISHNLFSLSQANQFDLGLYRRGAGKSEQFNAPGIVNVYCNIHPMMSAVIHVMSTPFYTWANQSGAFTLDVPAGRYRMTAWNELGTSEPVTIDVGTDGRVTGSAAVTIDSRNVRAQQQHLNKEGRPYAPPRDY